MALCYIDKAKSISVKINDKNYQLAVELSGVPKYKITLLWKGPYEDEKHYINIKASYFKAADISTTFLQVKPNFIKYFLVSRENPTVCFNVNCERWIYFEEVNDNQDDNQDDNAPGRQQTIVDSAKFFDDFTQLFAEEDNKDFTFKIGSEEIKVHKLILSARSPVFKKMFETEMIESTNSSVEIKDASYEAFKSFLEYIYYEKFDTENVSEDLLYLADKYEVFDLKSKSANSLIKNLDASNAVELLILFDRHRVVQLKQEVLYFIAQNKEASYPNEKRQMLEKSYSNLSDLIESVSYAFNRSAKLST